MKRSLMRERVAAIDLGKARCGVAVADELGMMAHARPFIDAHDRRRLLAALTKLSREEALTKFLVGLPLEMTGHNGPAANRAQAFAQELANATGLQVELVDERLSTVEAARKLRDGGTHAKANKSKIDGASAAVVLQAWLDARAPEHDDRDHDDG